MNDYDHSLSLAKNCSQSYLVSARARGRARGTPCTRAIARAKIQTCSCVARTSLASRRCMVNASEETCFLGSSQEPIPKKPTGKRIPRGRCKLFELFFHFKFKSKFDAFQAHRDALRKAFFSPERPPHEITMHVHGLHSSILAGPWGLLIVDKLN